MTRGKPILELLQLHKHCAWSIPNQKCLKKKSVFSLVQIFRCLHIDNELLMIRSRAREMSEWIKDLPHKLEYWNFDAQKSPKRQAGMADACNLRTLDTETGYGLGKLAS